MNRNLERSYYPNNNELWLQMGAYSKKDNNEKRGSTV